MKNPPFGWYLLEGFWIANCLFTGGYFKWIIFSFTLEKAPWLRLYLQKVTLQILAQKVQSQHRKPFLIPTNTALKCGLMCLLRGYGLKFQNSWYRFLSPAFLNHKIVYKHGSKVKWSFASKKNGNKKHIDYTWCIFRVSMHHSMVKAHCPGSVMSIFPGAKPFLVRACCEAVGMLNMIDSFCG